jgi:tRNA uridine 5-carbamoylmethylation protein Kti12
MRGIEYYSLFQISNNNYLTFKMQYQIDNQLKGSLFTFSVVNSRAPSHTVITKNMNGPVS